MFLGVLKNSCNEILEVIPGQKSMVEIFFSGLHHRLRIFFRIFSDFLNSYYREYFRTAGSVKYKIMQHFHYCLKIALPKAK